MSGCTSNGQEIKDVWASEPLLGVGSARKRILLPTLDGCTATGQNLESE